MSEPTVEGFPPPGRLLQSAFMLDVIIVGGGPAGLNAALILGRCRRRVLVCDSGRPRNWASRAIGGFLTRDGCPPNTLRCIAREQLAPYPDVRIEDVEVVATERSETGFRVLLAGGEERAARKLLLATGVVDDLPPLPGVEAFYGRGVHHCPYCDGWELRDAPLAAYVAGLVDDKLCRDDGDGYRNAKLPRLREAWRRGLRAIDAEARAAHGVGFHELGGQSQDRLLRLAKQGALHHPAWEGMPSDLFFNARLLRDVVHAYYSHPTAWNEIGFGGPASPRGYVRMGFDRRDPWEAAEASGGGEETARRKNRRVG